MPLLCSSSCETAENCGPTSEWPTCNSGGPTSGSGDDEQDNASDDDDKPEEPPKNTGGGKKDAGSKPPSVVFDAGALAPTPDNGDPEGASGGDAGAADAGDASVDARVHTIDGGTSADCTIESDGRDAGACYGVYCSVSQHDFSALSSVAGACSGDDLALACDGELSRVVSQCAQNDVFALGFGRTVALCAGRAPSLAKASEGCVSCFVDEVLCAVESCLAPCLNGDSSACTECRLESCGLAFRTCSGLPAANAPLVSDPRI